MNVTTATTGAAESAEDRVRAAYARIGEVDRPEVWISLLDEEEALAAARRVDERTASGADLPLAGTVFAVKDNIDVAGFTTTAGHPGYAYGPKESAPAVARLLDAGAVVLGKTNLDQFATGLVGTRSPYGKVRDAHRPDRVSGGSSAGSGVAVALGVVDFALGTDTAGSGRVPAAFGGIVGIKPTVGLVPTTGVVPACRTLDCVTVFAAELGLARLVAGLMSGVDDSDLRSRPWPVQAPLGAPPRPRVGVPDPAELVGMAPGWVTAFEAAVKRLADTGVETVPFHVKPFLEAGRLLYEGAFVAERYAAVGAFVTSPEAAEDLDPSVAAIIGNARGLPAHQLASDTERLDRLRAEAREEMTGLDAVLLPTVGEHPTITEVERDPIGVNTRLGTYTNFCNLFDMAAIAVPAGETADGAKFGVTLAAPAFSDHVIADIAERFLPGAPGAVALPPSVVPLVVVGAHLSGQPLNGQLTALGARLLAPVRTAATYRLFALDTEPPKPGLVRVTEGGARIGAELWALPRAGLGALLAELPAPMALGRVVLEGGAEHVGFLCEPAAVAGARDITSFGGWRAFLAAEG
ncbi:allophanate hydrolase [Thermobifida halotolerans]|uniref:Allophanate hydrolase n=1 Tax=Thermobifida halotolerans TaxID=483545 RepID=A0A399FZE6_9ACTN|nr:allophanate hydrolase [Thermobifida halotolerans]UOE18957.1 allophanate hydrolase [Thermobifida halotolerans]